MRISNYFSTLILSKQDIKQDARNLVLIGGWFTDSPLAKELKLTQALEWIAKTHGFKSYAAWQASEAPISEKYQAKCKLHEVIEHAHPADDLFLKVADSYLNTPIELYQNRIPVYVEPTPLLVFAIKLYAKRYPSDLFRSLATMNAIGTRLLRNHVGLGEAEATLVDNSSAKSLVKAVLRYTEITNAQGETYEYDWEVKIIDKWTDLTIENINMHVEIGEPQLNKGVLAKLLNAKSILEIDLISYTLDNSWRFTSKHPTFRETGGSYYDEPEREGLFIAYDPDTKSNQLKDSLELGDITISETIYLEIKYLDQDGQEQRIELDWIETDYTIYMSKNGFAFNDDYSEHKFSPSDKMEVGSVRHELFKIVREQIMKQMLKHQYILANMWTSKGGLLDEEDKHKMIKDMMQEAFDEEMNSLNRDIFENSREYMDEATYNDVFEIALKINPITTDTETYNLIWGKAYSDPRFESMRKEVLDKKAAELKKELSEKYSIPF